MLQDESEPRSIDEWLAERIQFNNDNQDFWTKTGRDVFDEPVKGYFRGGIAIGFIGGWLLAALLR